ncbi:MAG: HAD-IC family P-type ATPase [Candidatus Schekmanbacteria bacterium]|nr:HAD-IC family P-type ATPase [Candidatus Schekmanbacteria bacterium]
MSIEATQSWHSVSADDVLRSLRVDIDAGLGDSAIQERLNQFGENLLTVGKDPSKIITFLTQFHQPLIYILIVSGTISSVLGAVVDAAVIFGVVAVNAVIGYLQESRAIAAIASLARGMVTQAVVLRAATRKTVPASALVPGDVLLLCSGDKVPADARLVRCRDLRVEEAALTGESLPIVKQPAPLPPDASLAERTNMVYASTLVVHGTATAIVVATGTATEIGRVSEMIRTAELLATPLTRKIAAFSSALLWAILGLAAVTFGVGLLRGETWLEMLMAAVALAVGAIPEGLPAAMTITLAIGVSRMANRNAIIRRLPAVEALGSTTVICADKTGTLTQNAMTVQEVAAGDGVFRVTGTGYAPAGAILRAGTPVSAAQIPALQRCLQAGALCSEAKLTRRGAAWVVEGDPTEGALLAAAAKAGLVAAELAAQYPRLDAIPFESERQYMASLHRVANGKATLVFMKGAAESVLPRCDCALTERGDAGPIDAEAWRRRAEDMAARGLRVLALAMLEMPPTQDRLAPSQVRAGLTWLGLQGMIDPPRPNAAAAVRACQGAGIHVKMITGDHALTAAAVARDLGLFGAGDGTGDGAGDPVKVLSGTEIAALGEDDLAARARETAVFARVAPEQKLRLVMALQAQGQIVAMTGDGVNDAPALRRADIGVAMGQAGTEVAKEAADMVLTDDDFASIEAAVEEGRGVYDNLVKFITWTLPTNLGEGLVILAATFAGAALPILPVQILWINMTTAVLLGLMLAFEPKERDIMIRPPRDPGHPILTNVLIGRIVLVGVLLLIASFGLYSWELTAGAAEAAARTVAVNVFVVVELFYLFNCRSLERSMVRQGLFSNAWVSGGVSLMIALQLAFTYLPFMNKAFASHPIGAGSWARILVSGLICYGAVGLEKWLRLRTR